MSDRGPQFQQLQDEAVRLRPLEPVDVSTSIAWRNDPAIRDQVLSFRFPVTHVMEAKFVERAIAGEGIDQCVLGIVDRSDEALCGLIYLRDIDWISRNASLGILIGRQDRQGRGLGRRALNLILHHGFRVLNLERIYLYVAQYNRRAIQLYESAGFVHEGRLRSHVALEGSYHDLLVMGLLKSEFEKLK